MVRDNIKVLIINAYDIGGAANACLRLHLGLLNSNIQSKLLVKNKYKNYPAVYKFQQYSRGSFILKTLKKNKRFRKIFKNKKEAFIENRDPKLEMFSFPYSKFDITTSKLYKDADIINLHWIAGFIDYKSFFKKNTKPVVWTLHDMNPFTGGEHYSEKFLGIDNSGNPIKRKITEQEIEIIDRNLKIKEESLSCVNNLTVVAPSKWLQEEAKKSQVFKDKNVHLIPYGLDENIYKPKNKLESRKTLNLPDNKIIVLFVAHSLDNSRKGFAYLKSALESLNTSNVLLCSVGANSVEFNGSIETIHLGQINDEELMSKVYSAADVFVIPSLMDNLPNTVLESLMCGTPVIGFPVGGIPDMIDHGINGLLTKEISVASLQETLHYFIENNKKFDGNSIRMNALMKYNLDRQAKEYISLFKTLI
jgi:glycosyltransferase involved in cell wall biosynthesis